MSAIDVQIADKPYAILELPIYDEFESNIYAVPVCTVWLKNIKVCAKDGKQVAFAAICKWPPDESKLSDYLEKRKKPTDTWITYENVKSLKFCKSIRRAKEEAEKALNVSDLSQSDKDKSLKRQRFITRRYSPVNETSCNRRKSNIVYADDSDSDFELKAPAVRNLKISANDKNNKASPLLFGSDDSDDNFSDNSITQISYAPNNYSRTETPQTYGNNHKYNCKNHVMTRCDSNMNSIKQIQDVAFFSKSRESQISDAIHLTYSSIDRSVNESMGPVNHTKKKERCNVPKDLETNKQDKVMSEHENSDDRNSCTVIRQAQDICKSYVTPHNKSPVRNNASFNERTIMAASDLRSIDKLYVTIIKIYTATCHPEETLENSIGIPTLPLASMEEFYK
ncbi:uncharacterized protein [Polyergus mexicanus]|uniref:uncharacterized protein n=1 Tax=Polyergus mexicanus TaxID=615972 RepID=UPI0038B67B23